MFHSVFWDFDLGHRFFHHAIQRLLSGDNAHYPFGYFGYDL
jgi:hypothetical protein